MEEGADGEEETRAEAGKEKEVEKNKCFFHFDERKFWFVKAVNWFAGASVWWIKQSN